MPRNDSQFRRSALWSFRFLGTALAGSLTMALVSAFGPLHAQIAMLGAFVSILGGLFLSYLAQDDERERQRIEVLEQLSLPLSLASDPEFYAQYLAISRGLASLSRQQEPILRQIALLKVSSLAGQVADLANGRVVFTQTEGWRTVYEQLLRSPQLRHYQSVAWVRMADYWQDQPGRQSMQVNFEAIDRRVLIERIVIVTEDLWPKGQLLPSSEILPWIEEQHNHGLWLCLVRESDLSREADLLCDLGIYGDKAVGIQELDEQCRTLRFTLTFNAEAVRQGQERWRRLSLYGTPMRSLLDQLPPGA